MSLNAQIGYAPWDAFHAGLAKSLAISIGTALIGMGVLIVIVTVLLKETIGLGTILNMLLVGVFLDLILRIDLLPKAQSLPTGLIMLTVGLFIIALASYFYIGSGFGAGPRDSLMVVLARKTKLPLGLCRGSIELAAALAGWRLGGLVGIGTVISAILLGFSLQLTFKLLHFDATLVKHESLWKTCMTLLKATTPKSTPSPPGT